MLNIGTHKTDNKITIDDWIETLEPFFTPFGLYSISPNSSLECVKCVFIIKVNEYIFIHKTFGPLIFTFVCILYRTLRSHIVPWAKYPKFLYDVWWIQTFYCMFGLHEICCEIVDSLYCHILYLKCAQLLLNSRYELIWWRWHYRYYIIWIQKPLDWSVSS